ncbi:2OG-Fe(II) oxygenase [Synechococcus sp. RSCCF101]|uniref:prolyl hydroxylase family protein n=1 Tax=Synechococcus sp. RSCCF101 TaxID=2511069 RepID=UPI0012465CB8|nr:2OG-Fe(II) oxygenase [Synechococcus sp. RSCCF101]QEY32786.1 2OG-Fe(II) oxygenase [Synechococcus sp. RSCCF101]
MSAGGVIPDNWRRWLTLNRERGCDLSELTQRALAEGFPADAIRAVLVGDQAPEAVASRPAPDVTSPPISDAASAFFWRAMAAAPLTRRDHKPRAWRLDTDLAQLYELPDLLTEHDCLHLIGLIDQAARPSTVTQGPPDYRTSSTCDLACHSDPLLGALEARLAALIGVEPDRSEPMQGQRYEPGQYFRPHTDWFAPNTDEYRDHARQGGQRTWTVMVYLNGGCKGGATAFPRLGRRFQPLPGFALAWNNLDPEGRPNHHTLHEAEPVREGRKYVITKWFRERRPRHALSRR